MAAATDLLLIEDTTLLEKRKIIWYEALADKTFLAFSALTPRTGRLLFVLLQVLVALQLIYVPLAIPLLRDQPAIQGLMNFLTVITFIPGGSTYSALGLFIASVSIAGVAAAVLSYTIYVEGQMSSILLASARVLLVIVATACPLPLLTNTISSVFCPQNTSQWGGSSLQCFQGAHIAIAVIGVVMFVLLVVLLTVLTTLLHVRGMNAKAAPNN